MRSRNRKEWWMDQLFRKYIYLWNSLRSKYITPKKEKLNICVFLYVLPYVVLWNGLYVKNLRKNETSSIQIIFFWYDFAWKWFLGPPSLPKLKRLRPARKTQNLCCTVIYHQKLMIFAIVYIGSSDVVWPGGHVLRTGYFLSIFWSKLFTNKKIINRVKRSNFFGYFSENCNEPKKNSFQIGFSFE